MFLVNGLRLDASHGRPTINRLRKLGVNGSAESGFPTLSRPNYVNILAGVPPRWSGVRTNEFNGAVTLDTVVRRARAEGVPVTLIAQDAPSLPRLFPEADHAVLAPHDEFEPAARAALSARDGLFVLLYGAVNDAGHANGGARSSAYGDAVDELDAMIERLLGEVNLQQDTVIVLADHGMLDRGFHAGVERGVMEVPLVLAGAGVRAGTEVNMVPLGSVAPTLAALLGVPAPGHALAPALLDALALTDGEATTLRAADQRRTTDVRAALDALDAADARAGGRIAARRALAAAACLVVLLSLTLLASRRRVIAASGRVLALAAILLPLIASILAAGLWRALSPSRVVVSTIGRYAGLIAAIAVVLHLSVVLLVLRGHPRDRLASAGGVSLAGLVIAIAAAGACWALFSGPRALALVGNEVIRVPALAWLTTACHAVAVGLAALVEVILFTVRAASRQKQATRATA